MIKIERLAFVYPARLLERVENSTADLNVFFDEDPPLRIQKTPKFGDMIWKDLKPPVFKVPNGK